MTRFARLSTLTELAPLLLLIAVGAFNQISERADLNVSPKSETIAHGQNFDGPVVSFERSPSGGSVKLIVALFKAPDRPLAFVAGNGAIEGIIEAKYEEEIFFFTNVEPDRPRLKEPVEPLRLLGCQAFDQLAVDTACETYWPHSIEPVHYPATNDAPEWPGNP